MTIDSMVTAICHAVEAALENNDAADVLRRLIALSADWEGKLEEVESVDTDPYVEQ